MRCAVFHNEDGRHHRELPGSCTMKTVAMATKTVFTAMKTVFMPAKREISFEIFRTAATFVCYRRFSGSSAFPKCQDIPLFDNKGTLSFHFLPCLFYRLLINSGLEEENVRHGSSGISFQIEKPSNKGYCMFCRHGLSPIIIG